MSSEVTSLQELDDLLDRLEEEAERGDPLIVGLEMPNGASLSLGLGRSESVLNYVDSPDPPYYSSLGDEGAEGSIVFYLDGHWTELPRSAAIPIEDAREAMRRFFETGKRPENVRWQAD